MTIDAKNTLAGALKVGDWCIYSRGVRFEESCECWLRVAKVKKRLIRCDIVKRCGRIYCLHPQGSRCDIGHGCYVNRISDPLSIELEVRFGQS